MKNLRPVSVFVALAIVFVMAGSAILPSVAEARRLGDVNGNGAVESRDYMLVKRAVLKTYTLTEEQTLAADANRNSRLEAADYMMIKRAVLKTYTLEGYVVTHKHTPVTDPYVAPTCTESGLTEGSHCSECGEILKAQESISALGHDWDEGKITLEPACTEDGYRTFTCSRCRESKKEVIPAGHTVVIDAAVAPTCTKSGLTEGAHCSVCGEILKAQEIVPALGHEYDDDDVCIRCGEVYVYEESLKYFKFTKLEDGTYEVAASDTEALPEELEIPYEFRGKPVTAIANEGFIEKKSLIRIVIPEGVKRIGSSAFESCESLSVITLPESLEEIGSYAFFECAFTEMDIPFGVTQIGSKAFGGCTITELTVGKWIEEGGSAKDIGFDKIQIVTISDGVTGIGEIAFKDCSTLMSITLPDGVTSIGDNAFENCSRLRSVSIPDSIASIGYAAFYNSYGLQCNIYENGRYLGNNNNPYVVLISVIDASSTKFSINENTRIIYWRAFNGCADLRRIVIPNSVTYISAESFQRCTSLVSVTMSDSVTSIGSNAFQYCISLTSVNIPDGVTSIGTYAFNRCDSLTSIIIPGSVTSLFDSTFGECASLASVTLENGVKDIGFRSFQSCTSLARITIPDSVTVIDQCAFAGCQSLTNIIIPDSVTVIGSCAFQSCSSLTSISIPYGVAQIYENSFQNCSALTSIVIPYSVTSIGYYAFQNCSNLSTVYFTGTAEQWAIYIPIQSYNESLLRATKIFNYVP